MDAIERQHRPVFGIHVPEDLYWEIERACGGAFADSYLYEAIASNMQVLPWTLTAWERLRDNFSAVEVFKVLGYRLAKPKPFAGKPGAGR